MRKIIHIDMDCFYASVEIRDRPALRGKPVAVGGQPNQRGVLCTCNYEARKFGLHSAMSSALATRMCPGLIILPVDMAKYREESIQIRRIFTEYTDIIEPLSLDEAFLDVTQSPCCRGSATLMAQEIRQRIEERHRLTASAGIAPNKFLAKVASDWNKPNGQWVIAPDQVEPFIRDLPVGKIFGVGKVTARRLEALGLRTCGDLRHVPEEELRLRFGKFGGQLHQLSQGYDPRPVQPYRERKSVSVEQTFARDLSAETDCLRALTELYPQFQQRLRATGISGHIKSGFVKIKYADFTQTTVQRSLRDVQLANFQALCRQGLRRKPPPVRLLGLGVQFAPKSTVEAGGQLELPLQ